MSEPVHQLLSLIQLARRAREAGSMEALGFVMVNESLQVLSYRQAALWLAAPAGAALSHVAAVSGLPQPNAQAPYSHWLTQLFTTLAKQPTDQARASVCALTAQDVPALATDWVQWLPAHALLIPLQHAEQPLAGYLLLAGDKPWTDQDKAIATEMASSYAHCLASLNQRKRAFGGLRRIWAGGKRWWWLLALLIACFPVQQSVLAPAEVVPKDPFVVRAPQDGVIDRVLVKPNQTVAQGAALFNLDQTALQTRQSIASKAYDTAQEEFRQSAQSAVTDDKGRLEMALRRGALIEKQVELRYMNELMGRVQVKADRAGVAVFSDVADWQGKTVQLGERVLTLADPSKVEITIWLPVGERFDAQPGTQVSLYPNASPLSSYQAVLTQVAYSAEPARDGQMAYRLKADLTTGEPLPRIGLMGTAKLHGSRVPLIYYALRRPLTTMRQWLGL